MTENNEMPNKIFTRKYYPESVVQDLQERNKRLVEALSKIYSKTIDGVAMTIAKQALAENKE